MPRRPLTQVELAYLAEQNRREKITDARSVIFSLMAIASIACGGLVIVNQAATLREKINPFLVPFLCAGLIITLLVIIGVVYALKEVAEHFNT